MAFRGLLTSQGPGLQYRQFRCPDGLARFMSLNQPLPHGNAPQQRASMDQQCRHPRVRIVAREEDSEFVECLECGDIFESSEFKDMAIEENSAPSDA